MQIWKKIILFVTAFFFQINLKYAFLLYFYKIKEVKFHPVGKILERVTSDIVQNVNNQ